MSALIRAIEKKAQPMIGMIQLAPLPGSSRYAGAPLLEVLHRAIEEAAILATAGFDALMLQNLGDLPVGTSTAGPQVTWMTRIAHEVRQRFALPTGVNLLENDVEAMIAIASAADLDFVRIKVYVGAMVTPSGVEMGRAFEAIRARTAWRATDVAIFADVHDRTGVPVASAGLYDDVRTAFDIGGADGIVLTGRSHAETLEFLREARDGFPTKPILVGGGVTTANVSEILALADGAIVSSALKRSGSLFGELDPEKASTFMESVVAVRAS